MNAYFRLLKYISKYKKRFFIGLLFSLMASILNAISLSALMPIFHTMMNRDMKKPFELHLTKKDIYYLYQAGEKENLLKYFNRINGYEKEKKLLESDDPLIHSLQIENNKDGYQKKYYIFRSYLKLKINQFSSNYNQFEFLKIVCLAILPIYFLKLLTTLGAVYFITSTGLRAVRDVRNELYSSLVQLPLRHFVKEKAGSLMSRVINDVLLISDSLSVTFRVSIMNFFIIITHVSLLSIIDYKLTIICLIGVPLALWPVTHFAKKIKNITTGEQSGLASLNANLQQLITGIRVIRAFGMEPYEKKKFNHLNEYMYQQTLKYRLNHVIGPSIVELLTSFLVVGLLAYGASQILHHQITSGSFFTFLFTLIVILSPIKQMSSWFNDINRTVAAGDRLFQIIDDEKEEKELENPIHIGKIKKEIHFKNVSFVYPESTQYVLKNIELKVKAGSTIALVGHSGAGKSTLIDLIPRFYNVTEGAILIDGVNIQNTSLKELRNKIGVVTQEIFLFNGSIRENICFGRENVSEEKIMEVAKLSHADEFIDQLPNKFDTFIGERGLLLSGGQRQRISIARALLKDPEILILDEATSSLDSHSEKLVQEALKILMVDRTTFVVAHRLSTIYQADEIIVLEKGKIIERGSHKQLLRRSGIYKKLYKMQFAKT